MFDNPLRIVHYTREPSPESHNGVEKAVHYLSAAQRALGHDVAVVPDPAGDLPTETLHDLLQGLLPRVPPALMESVLAHRPDIVHLHSVHIPRNIWLARELHRHHVPYCLTTHGGLCRMARRRRRVSKAILNWVAEGAYLNRAAFIHVLTPDEAAEIRSYGVRRPMVCAANGIDLDALPKPRDRRALFAAVPRAEGRRVFMFIGRLDAFQKGLDILIEAFAQARQREPVLVLVGPDSKNGQARLEALVARFGLTDRVHFLGPTPHAVCADLIAGADVFVHPSRFEGMSLSVLEAAAWGKPCLLTAASDPGGVLSRGGASLVVEPTPHALAEGIRTMAEMEPNRLLEMGRNAETIVTTTFNWRVTADTLVRAYRDVANKTSLSAA